MKLAMITGVYEFGMEIVHGNLVLLALKQMCPHDYMNCRTASAHGELEKLQSHMILD